MNFTSPSRRSFSAGENRCSKGLTCTNALNSSRQRRPHMSSYSAKIVEPNSVLPTTLVFGQHFFRTFHALRTAGGSLIKEKMKDDCTKIVPGMTPESTAMSADFQRAMAITAKLNRLTYSDANEVRSLFGELIGKPVDDSFLLIPPFYTTGGSDISLGRNVFINQNCTFYDLGGLAIANDVMIGPNVGIIASGHPIGPSNRRAFVVAKPVVIERNVWIAAGATIIGGVTVGKNSVVTAGSVVTKDVPPDTLVGGNPARVIRAVGV